MASDWKRDGRLQYALELLRSIAADRDEEGADQIFGESAGPWAMPLLVPGDAEARLSATDLLSWWFRAPSRVPNPWDVYFGESFELPADSRPGKAVTHEDGGSTAPPLTPDWASAASDKVAAALVSKELANFAEDRVSDADAEAAVDCLFEFIHAIGRRDINQAMVFVAEDYHVLENDREIDRLALRHHIEKIVDSLRGWEMEVSLTETPEPLPYLDMLLMEVSIQIDAFRSRDDQRRSIIERRVALLRRNDDTHWVISGLSSI
jgi:hypothetical protein